MRSLEASTVDRCKPALFLLGLYPLARWVWLGANEGLTANPVEFLTRSAGTWTLVCLLVTLSVTPLRRLTGQPALVRLRRMCGLYTYFYACLHFLTWAWWDQGLDPSAMVHDVARRPFIAVGFTAFALMAPLALTSTRGWMRRLGRNWQRLHRIVYAVAVLAILHYWWHKAGKHDFATVSLYAGVVVLLLGWRLVAWLGRRSPGGTPARAVKDLR